MVALPIWPLGQAHGERQLAGLVRLQTNRRVHELLVDLLGCLGRDFLDVDAALCADHQDGPSSPAIDQQAEVQLAIDGQALFDEQTADHLAGRSRLVRHERPAEQIGSDPFGLIRALDDLDTAGLPAATGVNLCLDDHDTAAKTTSDLARLVC